MRKNALVLAVCASVAAVAGCADRPTPEDPHVVTLPGSGLRFAAKDANDRHLIVENGKECEHMADGLGNAAHPGRGTLRTAVLIPQPHSAGRAIAAAIHTDSGALFEAQREQVMVDRRKPQGILAHRRAAAVAAGPG